MKLLNKLERALTPFAVPNLTLGLIAAQVLVYIFAQTRPEILANAMLVPALVLQGEVWRLVSFLAVPPTMTLLFAFFAWYMLFLMGNALEQHWGVFRYNAFLFIGYLATVAAAFLVPNSPSTNAFLGGSLFLAFAFVYPEFMFYIFFVIPMKVKWLAALQWGLYIYEFAIGGLLTRALILASIINVLLFFWKDIVVRVRTGRRRMVGQIARAPQKKQAFHRCTACGITELTNPEMDFRYCSKCEGTYGYCTEHLRNHAHIKKSADPAPTADPTDKDTAKLSNS